MTWADDVVICKGENHIFDATTTNALYTWQDLSTSSTFIASEEGTYWVEVSFGLCSARDSVFLGTVDAPNVTLGDDTSLCDGQNLVLTATYPGSTYMWQDGSTLSEFNVTTPGLYSVNLSFGPCVVSEDIVVDYIEIPGFDLGRDTNLCQGTTLTLKPDLPDDVGYFWHDGTALDSFLVFEPGKYTLITNREQCSWTDSVRVTYTPLPEIFGGNDTTLCLEESAILTVKETSGQSNLTYTWSDLDGEISNKESILVTEAGQYLIEASNDCGTVSDQVNVQYILCNCNIYAPNSFTPNDDKINDFFKLEAFCEFNLFDLTIFDRYGQRVFQTDNPEDSWDGKVNGKVQEATTFVWVLEYRALNDGKNSKKKLFGKIALIR